MWNSARQLAQAAHAGTTQWGSLLVALRGLDWSSAAVLDEARRVVQAAAREYLQTGEWLARKLNLPVATVFRNLVVLSPSTALPMHRLAWRVAVDLPPLPGCDFPGWLTYLDRRARRHGVRFPLDRLCQVPPRLRTSDIALLLPAGRECFRALVLHAEDGLPRTPREAGQVLRRAVRRCEDAPPEQLVGWCRELWQGQALPRLGRAGFARLPGALRRVLQANTEEAKATAVVLLSAACREKLTQLFETHAETSCSSAPPSTRLAPADWLVSFTAANAEAQSLLLTDFSTLSVLADVEWFSLLKQAFDHAHPSPAVLQGFADHWLQRGSQPEAGPFCLGLLGWLQSRPEVLDAAPRADELADLLLDTLTDRVLLPEPADAAGRLSPGLLQRLHRHHRSLLGWFVWGLAGELLERHSTGLDSLTRFLRLVTQVDAALLLEAVPDELSVAAFQRLCEAWPGPVTHGAAERLRAVTAVRATRPVWLVLLERLRRRRLPVPQVVSELATAANLDTLRAAFLAYPDAFAERGPDLFPLRALLRIAFAHPRVARVVEQVVPRQQLVGQLDWVRRTWGQAPSVAAAFELALCFSLRDARFLCQLARQARRPPTPAERGHTFDHLYHSFERPKQNGGRRTITAPLPRLKRLQRRLLVNGFAQIPLHEAARGFRRGHSILTNAGPHVGQALVVNLDIEGFFPSTTYPLILRACRKLAGGRLSARALFLLADLVSYRGALPTGAPTSPAIGNILLTGADRALTTAAARRGAVYTRYADDLTFSGPGDTHRLIPFVKRVLGDLGYRVQRRKINLFRRGRRQLVTGLVVNDKPGWPRRLRRLLRAAVDRRCRGEPAVWQGHAVSDVQLRGLIAFLRLTAPEEADRLQARLQKG